MDYSLPNQKTKIVCTIGPASLSKDVLKRLIASGMSVARLNFSHAGLDAHRKSIRTIREASSETGRNIAILADLPGPKIRIGSIRGGSCILRQGDDVVLTTRSVTGTSSLIPVQFGEFPECVQAGERIFLNDGFIQLTVVGKKGRDIICRVDVGGRLLSKKGMNLPDSRLTLDAVTENDLALLSFGIEEGVDLFGLSFVSRALDIRKARRFASKKGREIFVVAKIERREALDHIEGIIAEADAIMVARGDLGVEIPIEQVPVVQKQLIIQANLASKPVITATQMLESMISNTRPTRAEATDVANAVFDGTDAVMLSEETAIGSYPAEACGMLSKIAQAAEAKRAAVPSGMIVPETIIRSVETASRSVEDVLSLDVVRSIGSLGINSVVVPTRGGSTARMISRFKSNAWIIALCRDEQALKHLCLSYGVHPLLKGDISSDEAIVSSLRGKGLISSRESVILVRQDPCGGLGSAHTLRVITPGPSG
ncbi:MAG TPA: pyruvate kinase [Deltaproteobacteria bacterium]|jgi:pyruvate kinase|nr:pyruvate kinase [Deltaproteobacteria bacterium]